MSATGEMKTILVVLAALVPLVWGASVADVSCPDTCNCQIVDEHLEATCASYEFIKKLLPKQVSKIVRLNINNASAVGIDAKLKYLKNLRVLDLSDNEISSSPPEFPYLPKLKVLNLRNNKLKSLPFSQLPKNLQEIDLSSNSFEDLPKDWSALTRLETLRLRNNPIDCVCDNLVVYEQLKTVGISKNLTCFNPVEFRGWSLDSVNCTIVKENLLNSMLGDESGSGAYEDEITFDEMRSHQDELLQAELLPAEVVPVTESHRQEDVEEEGSGEGSSEGSGFGGLIPILPIPTEPKACHFNCSTPTPLGVNDENNASEPPDVKEQGLILFKDIFEMGSEETTNKPEESTTEATSKGKEESEVVKSSDKNRDVETFPTNVTSQHEMERASTGSDPQSLYIVLGLVLAFVGFLGIYYINKKRNQKKNSNNRRNKANENGFGEEMKPLGKSADSNHEMNKSKSPIAESTPLLNGQNGKIGEEQNGKAATDDDLEEVELRQPSGLVLGTLTPQPERVTIIAGELPDSIPKTPVLVHRQLNSDGEIVTTTLNSN